MLETHIRFLTKPKFGRKTFLPPKFGNRFFEFIGKMVISFYWFILYWFFPYFSHILNDTAQKALSQSDSKNFKSTISPEQIDEIDFLHVDTNLQKIKVDWNFFGWTCSKLMWPVWLRDSKINCISKINRSNKLIFLHAGTNSGTLKFASVVYE